MIMIVSSENYFTVIKYIFRIFYLLYYHIYVYINLSVLTIHYYLIQISGPRNIKFAKGMYTFFHKVGSTKKGF